MVTHFSQMAVTSDRETRREVAQLKIKMTLVILKYGVLGAVDFQKVEEDGKIRQMTLDASGRNNDRKKTRRIAVDNP